MYMSLGLLEVGKDPMGAAIYDFFDKGKAGKLRVFSPQFDEDEIPVETLFREYDEMPELERKALDMAYGRILDVGAGSGCHSIALQDMGKQVEAIDISPLSVKVMEESGVNASLVNLFDVDERFRNNWFFTEYGSFLYPYERTVKPWWMCPYGFERFEIPV